MGKDVIIACDFAGKKETLDFLSQFKDEKPFVKIGMELFYAEGPDIVREIKARGHKIFLDLKLHDIPNTVKKAMHVLSRLDVDMCNLHAAGATDMMKAAIAVSYKIRFFTNQTIKLKEKMEEIRLINRAKMLLMQNLSMTEENAHKYIEKEAMNRCVKKILIAEEVIKSYG